MPFWMNRSGNAQLEPRVPAVGGEISVEHDDVGRLRPPARAAPAPYASTTYSRAGRRAAPRAAADGFAERIAREERLAAASGRTSASSSGRAPDSATPRRPRAPAPRARPRTTRRPARPRASGSSRRRLRSARGCSMNETPRPLIVSAITAFGRSVIARSVAPELLAAPRDRGRRSACTHQPYATELRLEVAEVDDLADQLVRLNLVVIDDHRELADPLLYASTAALRSSALPAARRRRSSRRPVRRSAGIAWPRRCRGPSRCPCRAIRSSPRCRHADVGMAVETAEPAQLQEPSRPGSTPSECSTAYRPGTSWPLEEK